MRNAVFVKLVEFCKLINVSPKNTINCIITHRKPKHIGKLR